MTDRHEELGRTLSTLLKEETDAMQIDTTAASQRLERELTQAKRGRRAAVAAAGIAAAVALGFVLWNQTDSPPAISPTDQPSNTETPGAPYLLDLSTDAQSPLPEQLVPDADPGLAAFYSPDGAAVALECEGGSCAGHSKLEVVSADGSVSVIPVGSEFTATPLAWSRDGTKLVYRKWETTTRADLGDLFVYDLGQAVSTQITDLGLEGVYWVDMRAGFSPDGEAVIYHRPRNQAQASPLDVWTVPVTGGEPTLVFRNAAQPEFLPDGRIAFVQPGSTSLTGRVVAVAAPGEPPQPLFEMPEEIISFQLSPDGTRALNSGEDGEQLVDVGTGDVSDLGLDAQWAGNDMLLVTPGS